MWVSMLINLGVLIVGRYGVPYLEQRFPNLKPLLEEILSVVNGKSQGSNALHTCAGQYCDLKGKL